MSRPRLANPYWISDATLTALRILAAADRPLTREQMAAETGTRPATVQNQLDRLIELGWAVTVAEPGAVLYELTDRGAAEQRSMDGGA